MSDQVILIEENLSIFEFKLFEFDTRFIQIYVIQIQIIKLYRQINSSSNCLRLIFQVVRIWIILNLSLMSSSCWFFLFFLSNWIWSSLNVNELDYEFFLFGSVLSTLCIWYELNYFLTHKLNKFPSHVILVYTYK